MAAGSRTHGCRRARQNGKLTPAKSERTASASWKSWRHLMRPNSSPIYRQSRFYGRCGRGTSSPGQRAAAGPPESLALGFARSASLGADRIESPYDAEARFRTKREMSWTGYLVHLTETCDPNAPRLVIHIDTTPASVHEARRTGPIHAALARKGLTPRAHLVDAAYVSARQLVEARERYGIDLVGPTPQDVSWQHRREGAFGMEAFRVDWERQRVRCPAGQHSMSWSEYQDKARGPRIKVHFSATACQACPSISRCARGRRPRDASSRSTPVRCTRRWPRPGRARRVTKNGASGVGAWIRQPIDYVEACETDGIA